MEFLVRIRDKTNTDFYRNVKLMKRGDVIAVKPDGWQWSPRELTNPDWRIIRVLNCPENEAYAMLSTEPRASQDHDERLLRKRAKLLNVDYSSLTTPQKNWLRNDARTQPIGEISLARIREMVQVKAALSDPNVIGPTSENVIG